MKHLRNGQNTAIKTRFEVVYYCVWLTVCVVFGYALNWEAAKLIANACFVILVFAPILVIVCNLPKISTELEDMRISVGTEKHFDITLTNTTNRISSRCKLIVQLVEIGNKRQMSNVGKSAWDLEIVEDVRRINAHSENTIAVKLPNSKRGVYIIKNIQVQKVDILRICQKDICVNVMRKLYVHPQIYKIGNQGTILHRDLSGKTSNNRCDEGFEIDIIRQWQEGESLKYISHKHSAVFDKVMVKQLLMNNISNNALILLNHSDFFSENRDFETAISALASISNSLIMQKTVHSVYDAAGQLIISNKSSNTSKVRHLLDVLSSISCDYNDSKQLFNHIDRNLKALNAQNVFLFIGKIDVDTKLIEKQLLNLSSIKSLKHLFLIISDYSEPPKYIQNYRGLGKIAKNYALQVKVAKNVTTTLLKISEPQDILRMGGA